MASKRELMKKKNKTLQMNTAQVSTAVDLILDDPAQTDISESQAESPITTDTSAPQAESPITADISAPQAESPVTADISAPQAESPVTADISAPQAESPITANISAPQAESLITANISVLQAESPVTADILVSQAVPQEEQQTISQEAPQEETSVIIDTPAKEEISLTKEKKEEKPQEISAKKLSSLPKTEKTSNNAYDSNLKIKRTNIHVSAEFKRRFERKMSDYLLIHARTPKERKMSTSKFISALMHMYVARNFEDIYMYDGYFEDQKKEETVSFLDFVSPAPAEAKDQVIGTDLPMDIAIELKRNADLYGISVAALLTSCLYTFIITPFSDEEKEIEKTKKKK